MSIDTFEKMNINVNDIKKQSHIKFMAFNFNKISTLGKSIIKCFYKQKCYFIEFFIIDFPCNTILGLTTCNNLNLISRVNLINKDKVQSGSTVPRIVVRAAVVRRKRVRFETAIN